MIAALSVSEFRMISRSAVGRLWLTVLLLASSWLATQWVRKGYTFEVSPLKHELATLPNEIDGWVGTDQPIEEGVLKLLAADSLINRGYQHPQYGNVLMHASVWVDPRKVASIAPHLPKVCYSNVGWVPVDERQVTLNVGGKPIPLSVLQFEKQGKQIVVAYWYQIGDVRFNTAVEARQLHRQLWGQPVWPATVKVLLQTSSDSIDEGLPILERFIASIYPPFAEL